MRFKPLTVGTLPRTFVKILALEEEQWAVVEEELRKVLSSLGIDATNPGEDFRLPVALANVLDLPKVDRARFATAFDKKLDVLCAEDFFGTEAENDPRGDHRD